MHAELIPLKKICRLGDEPFSLVAIPITREEVRNRISDGSFPIRCVKQKNNRILVSWVSVLSHNMQNALRQLREGK